MCLQFLFHREINCNNWARGHVRYSSTMAALNPIQAGLGIMNTEGCFLKYYCKEKCKNLARLCQSAETPRWEQTELGGKG